MIQKPVTIKTIAKELGLSVSAVSKALNGYSDINPETKLRVTLKADELGYSPNMLARSLVKKTSNFVGVVIRDVTTVYGEMFKALNNAARENGLNLILYDTNRDAGQESICVKNLIDSMAMGIVIAPVSKDVSAVRKLCKGRVPVVYLGGRATDERENFVATNSDMGARMAMDHLISLGHRDIALICDPPGSPSSRSNMTVYQEKMRALGRKERFFTEADMNGDSMAYGYRQAKKMLENRGEVTAVFAVRDMMAIGAIQAIRESGLRVPEDISVIGYDGIDAAALPLISLTTVAQPREEMANQIIRILMRRVEDPNLPPEHFYACPILTERKSCQKRG